MVAEGLDDFPTIILINSVLHKMMTTLLNCTKDTVEAASEQFFAS